MYQDMCKLLTEKSSGNARLQKFIITNHDVNAIIDGLMPGKEYIKLIVDDEIMMSNTPMELKTNEKFCKQAHGDVLIGGLGLGMILIAIQDKPEIRSITILEKNKNVIDIVAVQLPLNKKVNIINADVFNWKSEQRFDCIYMDIWDHINEWIYVKEMVPLKQKYKKCLKTFPKDRTRFIKCWAEYEAKNGKQLM